VAFIDLGENLTSKTVVEREGATMAPNIAQRIGGYFLPGVLIIASVTCESSQSRVPFPKISMSLARNLPPLCEKQHSPT
jgi:hypothetical protein